MMILPVAEDTLRRVTVGWQITEQHEQVREM
jgi:hypothetical protein